MSRFDATIHRAIVNAKKAIAEARILAGEGKIWRARSRYRSALDAWKGITKRHVEFISDMEAVAKEYELFNAGDRQWQERYAKIRQTLIIQEEILESALRHLLRIRPPSEFDKMLRHLEKDGIIKRTKSGKDHKITLA